MSKEDLHIKQAAALVVKLEGNSLFSSENIFGAASKYSKALSLCPMRSNKERVILYSNQFQCHLLLQQPLAAIRDTFVFYFTALAAEVTIVPPSNGSNCQALKCVFIWDLSGLLPLGTQFDLFRGTAAMKQDVDDMYSTNLSHTIKMEKIRQENRREGKSVSTVEMLAVSLPTCYEGGQLNFLVAPDGRNVPEERV
ncbi:uncharacterized protein DS421_4g124300 [Arachis hypogaea]|nr:uncharacterized protein DS421_4g124300 [Arachis hypogaea]